MIGNAPKLGYLDLSDPNILKLSDADFPHWQGWRKVESGVKADGTVDLGSLKDVFMEI